MRIKSLLIALSVFVVVNLLGLPESTHAKKDAAKPNVIVILTDDQGWGDLSLHGNKNLATPNLDQIAREGARFDRFYVCAVCSPTRAEFLTGRYHAKSGVYSTSAGGERMDLDETTIADTFKAAGYATGAFGKWHNGMQYPYHPNGRGFDEYYGFCSGHWGNYFDPMLERNGKIVRGKGFIVDDFTDQLMDFVESNKDKPFFAYLPLNTPHSPMQVPGKFWAKFKEADLGMRHRDPKKENLQHSRAALAMCENVDWNVGRILKKLDELELSENTIVVYFCDNGPNGARWNGKMKGRKGSTDEGGVRSPLFIRWPRKIKRNIEIKQIASVTDLLPTLAELCNVKLKSDNLLDGMSLKPYLLDGEAKTNDRVIVNHWKKKISIRTQRYRLSHDNQLFDIENDPEQRKNIAKSKPNLFQKLKTKADAYREEIRGYDNDQRPFIVGHPDFEFTQIPARDGIPSGEIKRSNRFPNCTYFYNWVREEDSISWDVSIPAEGEFEVEMYYACPKKDVGSEFEFRFTPNDATDDPQTIRVAGKITMAHDPPEFGAEQDRVTRIESYVKNFKPINVGKIKLPKAKGKLSLVATKKAGNEVMQFRLLMLRRMN